jgi:integrase
MDVDATVHGFRASFSTWAAEQTNFPREVAEQALAHTISDKVERAYKRTTLFDKRRQLMIAWTRYVASAPVQRRARDNVVAIGAR